MHPCVLRCNRSRVLSLGDRLFTSTLRILVRDISCRWVGESVDNVLGVYDSKPGVDVMRRCMFSLLFLLLFLVLLLLLLPLFVDDNEEDDDDAVSDFSSSQVVCCVSSRIIVRLYRKYKLNADNGRFGFERDSMVK